MHNIVTQTLLLDISRQILHWMKCLELLLEVSQNQCCKQVSHRKSTLASFCCSRSEWSWARMSKKGHERSHGLSQSSVHPSSDIFLVVMAMFMATEGLVTHTQTSRVISTLLAQDCRVYLRSLNSFRKHSWFINYLGFVRFYFEWNGTVIPFVHLCSSWETRVAR